jgi:hypothetical protein
MGVCSDQEEARRLVLRRRGVSTEPSSLQHPHCEDDVAHEAGPGTWVTWTEPSDRSDVDAPLLDSIGQLTSGVKPVTAWPVVTLKPSRARYHSKTNCRRVESIYDRLADASLFHSLELTVRIDSREPGASMGLD